MSYRIKNASGSQGTWVGQVIEDDAYYDIPDGELALWRNSTTVMTDVASGDLVVNSGTDVDGDFTFPPDGWRYLTGDTLPKSDLDGHKIAVHSSPKPTVPGSRTYAMWTGCGDDIAGNDIGDGPLLHFVSEVDTAVLSIDVEFLPSAGRVWIHEGYLKFVGGGEGDFVSADVRSYATALQQSVNLDLVIEDNYIKYAPGGAGTGTHGFAGTPVLLPRSFSHDGDWDYDGTNLTPNTGGTGEWAISDIERIVHRYINRIPCYGTVNNYFTMSSDETTELPSGYYLQIKQHNVSNTVWHASVIMEIYRERTHDP